MMLGISYELLCALVKYGYLISLHYIKRKVILSTVLFALMLMSPSKLCRQAWQKLGAMPPEDAMQKYIDIVSELYPTWLDGAPLVS
jgi:hypothetical protein